MEKILEWILYKWKLYKFREAGSKIWERDKKSCKNWTAVKTLCWKLGKPEPAAGTDKTHVYGIRELDLFKKLLEEINHNCKIQNIPASTTTSEFAPGQYEMVGDLTIKGITKTIILRGKYTGFIDAGKMGGQRMGYTAEGVIDRKDFGLNWNRNLDQGGVVVGNKVVIELKIQAVAS